MVQKTFIVTFPEGFDEAMWKADVDAVGIEEVLLGWIEYDATVEEVPTDGKEET